MPGLIAWIRRLLGSEAGAQSPSSELAVPGPEASTPPAPDQAGSGGTTTASPAAPAPQAAPVEQDPALLRRARLAAESLMENESLMPDLDSSTAQVLLEWGLDFVRKVVASSAGLADTEAEGAMAARMKATRQLMRAVNHWIGRTGLGSDEADHEAVEKVVESLAVIDPERFGQLDAARLQEILQGIQDLRPDPARWLAGLRRSLESWAGGNE